MPNTNINPPPTGASVSTRDSAPQGGWVSQHKGIVIGGIVLLAGGAYFILKRRSSSSSSTSNTTSSSPELIYPQSGTAGAANSSAANYAQGIVTAIVQGNAQTAAELAAQQTAFTKAIDGITATSKTVPSPSGGANPTPQPYKTSGSGEVYAPGVATQGGYVGIPTGTAAGAAERSGQTLYFSPAAGVFDAVTPQSNLKPTTELFLHK